MQHGFTGLYLHVPFCARKCGYCVFYSIENATDTMVKRYLQRLRADLFKYQSSLQKLQSVFIGGGTPTLLDPPSLEKLLATIKEVIGWQKIEFSVECNPGTLTAEKIAVLHQYGVNRISMGVQSFQQEFLSVLQRSLPPPVLEELVGTLRSVGVFNVNADLIYGIPGQTRQDWELDLRRTLNAGVTHVSTYELTLEEGGRLAEKGVPPCDEDLAINMWRTTEKVAVEFGFQRYEVSNLALAGWECVHNCDVWAGKPYLGLGPSAVSFDGKVRWVEASDFKRWVEGEKAVCDYLSPIQRAREVLAFGFRRTSGWRRSTFREVTGFDLVDTFGNVLQDLVDAGCLRSLSDGFVPTKRGLLLHDSIALRILEAENAFGE